MYFRSLRDEGAMKKKNVAVYGSEGESTEL